MIFTYVQEKITFPTWKDVISILKLNTSLPLLKFNPCVLWHLLFIEDVSQKFIRFSKLKGTGAGQDNKQSLICPSKKMTQNACSIFYLYVW